MEKDKVVIPVTVIALAARKPGMSLEYFKDYYSNHHLPYFYTLTNASDLVSSHTIHFVQRDAEGRPSVIAETGAEDWKYDSVTRIVFKDRNAFEEMKNRHGRHQFEISEDERKFLDQSTMKSIVMEESPCFEFP